MPDRRQQGRRWERAAELLLIQGGLRTLQRNFHCRRGEIDLVMLDGVALVFVEVRYRRSDHYGSGADSVTLAKQRRIISAAQHFLARHGRYRQRPCRFDVVSIGQRAGGVEMNWIRAAFEAA